MSFKRVGNDKSLLFLQKKRRINELFGSEIPSDEVTLMNDGRFSCLVCDAKPILDTIEIIKIHRNSPKHKEKFKKFLKQKQEKLLLIENRLHDAERSGQDTTFLEQKRCELANKSVLSTKTHSKKHQPKLKLQLTHCRSENGHEMTKKQLLVNAATVSQPSSQSRANCLDKVASTIHSPALEKLYKLSKLNESEKKQIQNDEISMKSRGWLKDKDGNWIKDPNVEFDSDDEVG